MRNGQYLATGAEHGRTGKVTESATNRVRMMDRRARKLKRIEVGGVEVPGLEYEGPEKPDVLMISYGSTIGAVHEAAGNLAAEGTKIGVCQVRMLNPLPVEQLTSLINTARIALVVENNSLGQLAYLMRANRVPYHNVQSILKYDGTLFRGDEVTELIKERIAEGVRAS
jgi:2-oxoglutarate ferredoxin oxidoreductase subunit alpha